MSNALRMSLAALLLCGAVGFAATDSADAASAKAKTHHVVKKTTPVTKTAVHHVARKKTVHVTKAAVHHARVRHAAVHHAVAHGKARVTKASVRTEQDRTRDLNRQSLQNTENSSGGSQP
jgi:hypothetical protein